MRNAAAAAAQPATATHHRTWAPHNMIALSLTVYGHRTLSSCIFHRRTVYEIAPLPIFEFDRSTAILVLRARRGRRQRNGEVRDTRGIWEGRERRARKFDARGSWPRSSMTRKLTIAVLPEGRGFCMKGHQPLLRKFRLRRSTTSSWIRTRVPAEAAGRTSTWSVDSRLVHLISTRIYAPTPSALWFFFSSNLHLLLLLRPRLSYLFRWVDYGTLGTDSFRATPPLLFPEQLHSNHFHEVI